MSSSPSSSAGPSPGVPRARGQRLRGRHARERERSLGELALLVLDEEHVRAGVVELEGDLGRREAPRDRVQDRAQPSRTRRRVRCARPSCRSASRRRSPCGERRSRARRSASSSSRVGRQRRPRDRRRPGPAWCGRGRAASGRSCAGSPEELRRRARGTSPAAPRRRGGPSLAISSTRAPANPLARAARAFRASTTLSSVPCRISVGAAIDARRRRRTSSPAAACACQPAGSGGFASAAARRARRRAPAGGARRRARSRRSGAARRRARATAPRRRAASSPRAAGRRPAPPGVVQQSTSLSTRVGRLDARAPARSSRRGSHRARARARPRPRRAPAARRRPSRATVYGPAGLSRLADAAVVER